jgi:hypothetical protein
MITAQINLPKLDNDGVALDGAHADLKRELLAQFGGATVWDAQGLWLDDGKVYAEEVGVYQVAISSDADAANSIRALAIKAGRGAKQLAMFVIIDGKPEIITI